MTDFFIERMLLLKAACNGSFESISKEDVSEGSVLFPESIFCYFCWFFM